MDYEVMTFKDLKALGIPYGRSQIKRLQKRKTDPFPESFALGEGRGARRVYWKHKVIEWLKRMSAR